MFLEKNIVFPTLGARKKEASLQPPEDIQVEIISTETAAEELKKVFVERHPYSLNLAEQEKPLMHYSSAGNIFQILRFGIQSNNFKTRLNKLRITEPSINDLAEKMCGLRVRQGGSYQGSDSISLSKYSSDMFAPSNNILFLVSSDIKTFGDSGRDASVGYGHGISAENGDDYELGNPTAYKNEVLAANIILPRDIKAVVLNKFTYILQDLNRVIRENVKIFFQEKNKSKNSAEDLMANVKLLANMVNRKDLEEEFLDLQNKLPEMDYQEICLKIGQIQQKALSDFVGKDNKLNENSLKAAIKEYFDIDFIEK